MGMKLHRGRRSVFKKRYSFLRGVLLCIGGIAIVAAGFFGAKYLSQHPVSPAPSESLSSSQPSSPSSDVSLPAVTTPSNQSMRAFFLPHAVLNDEASRTSSVSEAVQAGFDSVVLEMKDAAGTLFYRSANEKAQQVNSFAEDALTMQQLQSLLASFKQAGLRTIVQLHAFSDHAAARVLSAARITPQGNSSWVWYDNNPNNGGKAWLNPYADEAQLYIIDLARELRDAGADAVLLDSVQFPKQTSGADFGSSSNASMSHSEILTAFIARSRELLGSECPVILACTESSALGENTQIYGGNPLTFAPAVAAPYLSLSSPAAPESGKETAQAVIKQMDTRLKIIQADERPMLAPILSTDGYTDEQLCQLIDGCEDGGTTSFILFSSKGQYPFAALKD